MADEIGSIRFPPEPPGNTPIADPLVRKFGQYLSSYINANLSRDWAKLAPNSGKPVKAVREANSKRAAFTESELPSLFVFRNRLKPQRMGDDLWWDFTDLYALWMPAAASPEQRERRDPFTARIGLAIQHAVKLGRHPDWIDAGDTDASAATYGSVLVSRLGLAQIPHVKDIDFDPRIMVTIGEKPTSFDAVLVHIECVELTTLDPSVRGVESKQTNVVQQGSPGGDGDDHAGDFTVTRTYE